MIIAGGDHVARVPDLARHSQTTSVATHMAKRDQTRNPHKDIQQMRFLPDIMKKYLDPSFPSWARCSVFGHPLAKRICDRYPCAVVIARDEAPRPEHVSKGIAHDNWAYLPLSATTAAWLFATDEDLRTFMSYYALEALT